jgi:hypothetical protein
MAINTIKATVPMEKSIHFKTNKVPLSSYIKHFVEFFIQHVWPVLDQHTHASKKPLLCLWINTHGTPLQFSSYTQGIKHVSQEFHLLLLLMSLSYQCSFVTSFCERKIAFMGSFNNFQHDVGRLLNVSEAVMERHYDWQTVRPTNVATQEQLAAGMNFSDARVHAQLDHTSAMLKQANNPNLLILAEAVPQ